MTVTGPPLVLPQAMLAAFTGVDVECCDCNLACLQLYLRLFWL